MNIGIDARPLSLQEEGIPRVVKSLVSELVRIDQENSYYLYSQRDFDLPLDNPRWHKRIGSRCSFLPGSIWFQTEARRAILEDNLDIFWGTQHTLPLSLPSKVAKVLTIHDLVWRLYPRTMTLKNYCNYRLFAERSIQQANRVISDSESTARDLQRILNVPESKIEVIHLGVGPAYKPHDPRAAAEYLASKYGVSKDYVLTVGKMTPRKNLSVLVEAMKILRDRGEHSLQLLVAGAKGWKTAKVFKSVERFGLTESDIRFLGFVPEEDLPVLYSGACIFLFPSLYEGFGLPLVEAMACGVPIVASNTSSIPEVVQDAALLVLPNRPQDFAEAILRVRGDMDVRRTMIGRGLRRAGCFRWDKAASRVLECMERVVTKRQRGMAAEPRADERWRRYASLLACPDCHSRLAVSADLFRCEECGISWPIVGGIPTFLSQSSAQTSFYDQTYWGRRGSRRLSSDDRFYLKVVNCWLDRLQVGSSSVYLDVSCGEGHALYAATERGARSIGIDISIVAMRAGQEKFGLTGAILKDASSLPFPDSTFDRVSCLGSLEHFPDPRRALDEMRRVAQPSALFLFLVPNARHIFRSIVSVADPQTIVTALDERGWIEFFHQLGFAVIGQWIDNHTYHRPVRPFKLRRVVRRAMAPLCELAGRKYAWQLCFLLRKAG